MASTEVLIESACRRLRENLEADGDWCYCIPIPGSRGSFFTSDSDIAMVVAYAEHAINIGIRRPCCVVSYDYDFGWIVEMLTISGEYELRDSPRYGHNEDARCAALRDAEIHASRNGGQIAYFYETPDSVVAKRASYLRRKGIGK